MRMSMALSMVLVVPCTASALSAAGYEKSVQMSEAPGPNRFMAKTSIESYFQGVSETLNFLKTGTNHIYFQDRPYLCIPPSANLSAAMLRGMLDAELANPETVLKLFGSEWREYQIPTLLVPLIARTFPCQK